MFGVPTKTIVAVVVIVAVVLFAYNKNASLRKALGAGA